MRNLLLAVVLILVQFSYAQNDRSKAEEAVTNYMKKINKTYKSLEFGEFFIQTYPNKVKNKIKTEKKLGIHSFIYD